MLLVFGLFLLIFLVFCFILATIHLFLQRTKRQRDDFLTGDFPLGRHPGQEVCYDCCETDVQFLASAREIQQTMCQLIARASHEVVLCTYRWRVEFDPGPNGQIMAIGTALAQLQKQRKHVNMYILTNQMLSIESNSFVQDQMDTTLAIWRQLGFDNEGTVRVYFRTWKHLTLANIHDKFLVVDGLDVMSYSMNVENYSHGRESSWIECGLQLLNAKPVASALVTHFFTNWEESTPFEVGVVDVPNITEYQDFSCDLSPTHQTHAKVHLLTRRPSALAWNRQNILTSNIIQLLQSARDSICICTPNLNDISILNACKTHTRVVLSSGFNVDAPVIQELFLGWSTNERMTSRYTTYPNLHVRWNARENQFVVGKVPYALHAKLFLIDGYILIAGSVNCDVYSTVTSGEVAMIVFSKELVSQALETFFEPLWLRALEF